MAASPAADPVTFTDVTKASGITFSHVWSTGQEVHPRVDERRRSARSTSTTTAGSTSTWSTRRPSRPHPTPRGARSELWRNRGDGTFADVTEKAGVGSTRLGHGCGGRRFRQRRPDRSLRDLLRTEPPLSEQWRRHVHRRHRQGRRRRSALVHRRGLRRLRRRRLARSVRRQLRRRPARRAARVRQGQVLRVPRRSRAVRPARLCRDPATRSIATAATARSRTCRPRPAWPTATAASEWAPVWSDLDGDGRPDLFVANDAGPNFLYRNAGDGTFKEVALEAGVALSEDGKEQGSMGVADRRLRSLGPLGHLRHQLRRRIQRALPSRQGSPVRRRVVRVAHGEGEHPAGRLGAHFLDYDNDGWLDLFAVNGHVYPQVERAGSDQPLRPAQAAVPQQSRRHVH